MSDTKSVDDMRAELNAAMLKHGPLCPADLDPRVWAAVAALYPDADWSPAPEYHTEYRDAREAWLATRELT